MTIARVCGAIVVVLYDRHMRCVGPRAMRFALLALLLTSCSSETVHVQAADQPAPATTGDPSDPAGSSTPAADPYETAVLDAKWSKLAGAPSVTGGRKMDDVFFTSADVGYLANGPGSAIMKTTDGGTTWTKVFSNAGTYFRALGFVDEKHGFAGNLGAGLTSSITDATVLYETKDAGATWTPVTTITGDAPKGICNLFVIDATHLVGVGRANGPAHFMTSSDAGATWKSIDLGSQLTMLIDAHFSTPTEGVVVGMGKGSACTILRTTDGGATFSQVFESKTVNSLCWKASFPSDKVGYVAVQDAADGPPTFAKTTDGGANWVEKDLPAQANAADGYPAIGVGFVTEKIGWMSPEDPALPTYRTSDGGETWTVDTKLASPINRFRFVDKKTAYAVGGAMWKLSIAAP